MTAESVPEPFEPLPIAEASPEQVESNYWQRVKNLYRAGAEDYRQGGPAQKVGLLATAAWMAYEWGPGNEAVTPVLAGQLMNHTSGWEGVITTAAISGGFTFAQQTASGVTVAKTASTFPRLAEEAYELSGGAEDDDRDGSWVKLSKKRQAAYAFSLGSSFVVTREAAMTGSSDGRHLSKQAVRSAAISATAVTGAAGAVDAAATTLRNTPAEGVINVGVDILSNPLTWLGGFSLAAVYGHLKRRRQSS